jgi:3-oxoacyl-(acyl-carrier-protein) synthase
VVVTGMGVVSPAGTGKAAFWEGLLAGRSGVRFLDLIHADRLRIRIGAQIKDFTFNVPKERVGQLDRYAQMGLVAVREAWSQSGVSGTFDAGRGGVYFGTSLGGAGILESAYVDLLEKNAPRVQPMTIIGTMPNAAAAHIAIECGIQGPSLTYAVACASSAVAIGEAFRAIRSGSVDVALAGGAESLLTFGIMKSWEALMTLAVADKARPETSCRPFAADRTGLVLGEGAGAMVLEEYEHARTRGADILGEIAGYGLTNDGVHLSRPDAAGQERAMRAALNEAQGLGVRAEDIAYLNAHGTGTRAGDKTETEAIKRAFGDDQARALAISSTKALHGHLMGAAGAVEFIASLLALQAAVAPPTAHLWAGDPECDLDYVPLAPRTLSEPRAVMSNSFAFGGTNAVLIACRT